MSSYYICEDALCNKKYKEKPKGCKCICGRYCRFEMVNIVTKDNINTARKNINPRR